MNLGSQFWEIYLQDKPEKVATKAQRHKEYLLLFFLSALVTWWQKEKG